MASEGFRGVVVGSPFSYQRTTEWREFSGHVTSVEDEYLVEFDAADALVRHILFYFDKIALPTSNLLPPVADMHYLECEGELETFPIEVPGVERTAAMLVGYRNASRSRVAPGLHGQNMHVPIDWISQHHREIFYRHERMQPGIWNFAQVGHVREFMNEKPVRGYSMDLYDCLPVPSDDASFEDILRFKRRERNALLDLRAELDAIYIRIASCDNDVEFAAAHEIAELRRAILAVEDLLNTSRLAHYRKSVQIELQPKTVISALRNAGAVAGIAAKLQMPERVVIAAGTLAAAAHVIGIKDIPSPLERAGAFRYIYNAAKDQVVPRRQ